MKVLVLAAGQSKRMKPVKDKNFLDFMGKPLIQHQLELLINSGFDDFVLVGGPHNLERLKDLAQRMEIKAKFAKQIDYSHGMSSAVLAAADFIKGAPVLIFSSNDVVDDSAFKAVRDAAESGDAESYLLGMKVEEYFPGGYLEVDGDGYIRHIVEKPGAGNEPSDMVNLVVHLHKNTDRLIAELEKVASEKDDHYELAMANMMKDGVKMKAVPYDGFWQAVKFPWHIHRVFGYLFEKVKGLGELNIDPTADISKHAIIVGDVIIGENVKVFEGAVIKGPSYIGPNSVVANGALLRDSHVGEGCVIGFSTEVARSYLGSEVWTHSNYIGDSVIGDNVGFGAGTVTGNFRLDEGNVQYIHGDKKVDTQTPKFGLVTGSNVRVGVNTSTMPGVKIGDNCFIGAGIVIAKDVPEGSFVRGTWELKVSENKVSLEGKSRDQFKKKI